MNIVRRTVTFALALVLLGAAACGTGSSAPTRSTWSGGAGPRPTNALEYSNWFTDMTDQLASEAGLWANAFGEASSSNNFALLTPHRMRMEATLSRAEADVREVTAIGSGGEHFKSAFLGFLAIERVLVQALVPAESLTRDGVAAYGESLQSTIKLEETASGMMKERQKEYAELNGFTIASE